VPNETQALTPNHRRAASESYDSPQRRGGHRGGESENKNSANSVPPLPNGNSRSDL